jgi:hypothetical protein
MINSINNLYPMLVQYEDGQKQEIIVLIDFIGEKVFDLSGNLFVGKLGDEIIEIVKEKKKFVPQVPTDMMEKLSKLKEKNAGKPQY